MEKYGGYCQAKEAADQLFEGSTESLEIVEIRKLSDHNRSYFIVKSESEKPFATTDDSVATTIKTYRRSK